MELDKIMPLKIRFKSDLIEYSEETFTFSQVAFAATATKIEIKITLEDERKAVAEVKLEVNLVCGRMEVNLDPDAIAQGLVGYNQNDNLNAKILKVDRLGTVYI